MNINKAKNTWIIVLALLVILPAVLAAITVHIKWTSNLNNFNAQAYHCKDSGCLEVDNKLVDVSSGNNNYLITQFQAANGTTDYNSVYLQKECYVPKGFIINTNGNGFFNFNYNLIDENAFIKKTNCLASIQDLVLSNKQVATGTPLIVTANIKSAFSDRFGESGTPGFIPEVLKQEFYSSKVNVTLQIFDARSAFVFEDKAAPLFSESKTVEILLGTNQDVVFTFVPSQEGYYAAKITTKIIDCKCSSIQDDSQYMIFNVVRGSGTTTTTTTTTTIPGGTTTTTTPGNTTTTTTQTTTTTVSSGGGGSSSSGSKDVFYLDNVRLARYSFMPGEQLEINVDLRKDVGRTLRGIAIRVNIPGLGISRTSDKFVLDEKEETKQFDVTIPGDAESGDYVMDVIVFNDDRTLDRYVKFTVTGEKTGQAGITTTSITGLEGITGSAVRIPDTGSLLNSGLFRIGLMAVLTMVIFYIIWRI